MKEYLVSLTSYNVWANERIKNYIFEAGESIGSMQQKSSFPTIRETLIHILDAQSIWLDRLNGQTVTDWPGKSFTGSTLEAAELLCRNSKVLLHYVNTFHAENLENLIDYTNIKGTPFSSKVMHIVAHVMNHSTYHRGQIITMLRGAGFTTIGCTDLIAYFRESKA